MKIGENPPRQINYFISFLNLMDKKYTNKNYVSNILNKTIGYIFQDILDQYWPLFWEAYVKEKVQQYRNEIPEVKSRKRKNDENPFEFLKKKDNQSFEFLKKQYSESSSDDESYHENNNGFDINNTKTILNYNKNNKKNDDVYKKNNNNDNENIFDDLVSNISSVHDSNEYDVSIDENEENYDQKSFNVNDNNSYKSNNKSIEDENEDNEELIYEENNQNQSYNEMNDNENNENDNFLGLNYSTNILSEDEEILSYNFKDTNSIGEFVSQFRQKVKNVIAKNSNTEGNNNEIEKLIEGFINFVFFLIEYVEIRK